MVIVIIGIVFRIVDPETFKTMGSNMWSLCWADWIFLLVLCLFLCFVCWTDSCLGTAVEATDSMEANYSRPHWFPGC